MTDQIKTHMTAAEFLALPESEGRMELINGEITVPPAPSAGHQRIAYRLAKLIEQVAGRGEVYLSPIDVHLAEDLVVEPDVLWVSPENESCMLVNDQYWQGPPDLIVEVLSPGSLVRDKRVKFAYYEQHGVGEYWIIDPRPPQHAEVWRLVQGEFKRQGIYGPDEAFESTVLGDQMIDLATIFS